MFGANDLGAFETQDVVGAPGLIFADGMEEVPPFENNVAVAIPDNTLAGVESSIQVGLIAPVAPSVRVYVRIDHTFIGDLVVDLISPRGDVHNLHNRTGGSANNIDTEFVVTNTPELPNGTWRLRVSDRASLDTGTLVRWRLTF